MQVITWIPTDAAASVIVEALASDWPYLHLVHPKPIQWSSVITPIAKALHVPLVSLEEWTEKLQHALEKLGSEESAVQAAAENPAMKLVDFYIGAASAVAASSDRFGASGMEHEAFSLSRLETTETVRVSKSLANLPTLSNEDVERWLGYWKSKGAL